MKLRFGIGVGLLVVSGAAIAQANFDGVYRAPSGGVPGNSACGTTKFGYPLRVSKGAVTLQTVSQGELQGQVGPDGSVSFGRGSALVAGRISGNQFVGTYTVGRCQFALQYSKG